jgi:hypothetical protein
MGYIKEMIRFQSLALQVLRSPEGRTFQPSSAHGVCTERYSVFNAFLDMFYVAFRVPSKGVLPPCFLRSVERDAPLPENNLMSLKVLDKTSPLPGNPKSSILRELPLYIAFLYISLRVPNR